MSPDRQCKAERLKPACVDQLSKLGVRRQLCTMSCGVLWRRVAAVIVAFKARQMFRCLHVCKPVGHPARADASVCLGYLAGARTSPHLRLEPFCESEDGTLFMPHRAMARTHRLGKLA